MSARACGCPPGRVVRRVSPGCSTAGNSGVPFRPPAAVVARMLQSQVAAAPAPRLLPAGLPGCRAPAALACCAVPPAAGLGAAPGSGAPEPAARARASRGRTPATLHRRGRRATSERAPPQSALPAAAWRAPPVPTCRCRPCPERSPSDSPPRPPSVRVSPVPAHAHRSWLPSAPPPNPTAALTEAVPRAAHLVGAPPAAQVAAGSVQDACDRASWRARLHRAAPSGVPHATGRGSPRPHAQREKPRLALPAR